MEDNTHSIRGEYEMNGLTNGIGINVEVERNWTWVRGKTYPIKEELKQQGFLWSVKRRAWYNRSIVEVKLNDNGHGIKPTQHSTEHAQEAKTPIEMVKVRVLEDLPEIVGIDDKIYKLKQGEVKEIPSENAEALIKSGAATKEVIEPKTEKKKGLTTTERNRAIKKVLSKEFGAKNVHVIGDKGTAYGWVKVLITLPMGFEIKTTEGYYTEEAGEYISKNDKRVIEILKNEGLWNQLGVYYDDMNEKRKEILIDVKLVEGVKQEEKTLEEEVFEYIKTKEAYPLISCEWLSKQEKIGKTFLQLKPQIDNLIEDSLETEKRVKESEKEKDLHDWVIARNKELKGSEQIKDPHKRIEKVNEIVKRYNETTDKNWVTSEQYAAQIRVKAKREIWKTKQEEELSEHDKALLEGDYKIEGKLPSEEKKAWRTEEYEKTVNELKERFGMLNPM